MTPIAPSPRGRRSGGLTPGDAPSVVRGTELRYPTTAPERVLLMATIALLPMQQLLPIVGGISSLYLIFVVLAAYLLLNRPRALARTWLQPVFLAAYALIAVSALIELAHPLSDYSEIFRLGEMVAGAIFVASLCRDRLSLRAGMYGYLIAGVWLSLTLFSTSYGQLRHATADNFYEASKIRREFILEDNPLATNPNTMAFIAAQGAVVALALALTARSPSRRALFLGVALFCSVAAFLPMSRSGIITLGVCCAIVLFAHGIDVKTVGLAAVLGVCVLMWVPQAALSRFDFGGQSYEGKVVDGRARVYTAAVEHLPEYVVTGVGAGTFNEWWGYKNGWRNRLHTVTGAHNCFIQVTIYWGLAGLVALMAVVYQAYYCMPKRCGVDTLSLCLLGIAMSLVFLASVSHRFHGKEFSLGLGLLVGARYWIWPRGIVPVGAQKHWRFSPLRKPARRAVAFAAR